MAHSDGLAVVDACCTVTMDKCCMYSVVAVALFDTFSSSLWHERAFAGENDVFLMVPP